jgi:hypothetical protein
MEGLFAESSLNCRPCSTVKIEKIKEKAWSNLYAQQDLAFQRLISADHPLCHFYIALSNLSKFQMKQYRLPSLHQLWLILKDQVTFSCKHCGIIFSAKRTHDFRMHEKECGVKKPAIDGRLVQRALLKFGERDFLCQICGQHRQEASEMVRHLTQHSQAELRAFKLNLDFLESVSDDAVIQRQDTAVAMETFEIDHKNFSF